MATFNVPGLGISATGAASSFGAATFAGQIVQTGTAVARFENSFVTPPSGATGIGVELGGGTTFAAIQAYNRTTLAFAPLQFLGSSFTFANAVIVTAGGISVAAGTSISMAAGSEQLITDAGASGSTALVFKRWNGSSYVEQGRFASGGILAWGTTVTTGVSAGSIVLPNQTALRGVNAAGSTTVPMVFVDANNIVQLGQATNPPAMPTQTSTTFGGTSAGQKGLFFVPSDLAGTLIFYDGATGARFKLVGTSF